MRAGAVRHAQDGAEIVRVLDAIEEDEEGILVLLARDGKDLIEGVIVAVLAQRHDTLVGDARGVACERGLGNGLRETRAAFAMSRSARIGLSFETVSATSNRWTRCALRASRQDSSRPRRACAAQAAPRTKRYAPPPAGGPREALHAGGRNTTR